MYDLISVLIARFNSILVVDDNLQNLQHLGNILEENGFEPTLIRGGPRALELLARVKTLIEVKILRGMLPICSSCKKIRNDEGCWKRVEAYTQGHAQVTFSHGICPRLHEKALWKPALVRKKGEGGGISRIRR